MRIFSISVILMAVILSGCIDDKCDAECDLPASALTEIATLGATLTVEGVPLSESVGQSYIDGEEPFVVARINLYFSPSTEHEYIEFDVVDGFASQFSETENYEYTFSHSVNGQFIEIAPTHTTWDPPGPANQYSSAVRLYSVPADLIVNGNHIIKTDLGVNFAAPARSTHVELWYRENEVTERKLVRRVPLDSFDFWTRYLEPLMVVN